MLESYQNAAAARAVGKLSEEIVPIVLPYGSETVMEDGCIQPGMALEAQAKLNPAFR